MKRPAPSTLGALREQGYRTGAFVSAFPLDSRFGLDRGFDVYDFRPVRSYHNCWNRATDE